jgi:hypothetical protein
VRPGPRVRVSVWRDVFRSSLKQMLRQHRRMSLCVYPSIGNVINALVSSVPLAGNFTRTTGARGDSSPIRSARDRVAFDLSRLRGNSALVAEIVRFWPASTFARATLLASRARFWLPSSRGLVHSLCCRSPRSLVSLPCRFARQLRCRIDLRGRLARGIERSLKT